MNRINLKMLTLIVLCLFVEMIHAQKITEWIGGASGREQDWFCNKNWTTQTVPNEFSTVIIKNRFTNKAVISKNKMRYCESLEFRNGAFSGTFH